MASNVVRNDIDCCWKWQRLFQMATTVYERVISIRGQNFVASKSRRLNSEGPAAKEMRRLLWEAKVFVVFTKTTIDCGSK